MKNLASIKAKTDNQYNAILLRKRTKYKLARKLNLPPRYASVVSTWSEDQILALAKEYAASLSQSSE